MLCITSCCWERERKYIYIYICHDSCVLTWIINKVKHRKSKNLTTWRSEWKAYEPGSDCLETSALVLAEQRTNRQQRPFRQPIFHRKALLSKSSRAYDLSAPRGFVCSRWICLAVWPALLKHLQTAVWEPTNPFVYLNLNRLRFCVSQRLLSGPK